MEERNALALSKSSEWLTLLHAAFQDDENLYLVMEYACGGSLRSLINQREEGMPEIEAKFYIAELLMGLNELHGMKFIHR
jgi:serine/threonine-protein kinase MRCK